MRQKLYNLDGLRFLAALIVVLSHVEGFKKRLGIKSSEWWLQTYSAQLAVTFFFVLSGFLITYLLILEKKKNPADKIDLRHFYKKRILRIWPLYYLLVLLAFFVLNKTPLFAGYTGQVEESISIQNLLGYIFFLPNFSQLQYGEQAYLGQVWSLGVEEFFYLFFPIVIYYTRLSRIRVVLILITCFFVIISVGIHFINTTGEDSTIKGYSWFYLNRYRIYGFTMGGIAGSLLALPLSKSFLLINILKKKITAAALGILLLILIASEFTFYLTTQHVYAILFSAFIFSLVISGARFKLLNHPISVYLGKISYGIYMLHPIAIIFVLKTLPGNQSTAMYLYVMVPLACLAVTILLAALSYEFFEKYFLRFARKRSVEQSTQ